MIGDRNVFEASHLGGDDHFSQAGFAVGGGRMHVQVAANVRDLDQLGQFARFAAATKFMSIMILLFQAMKLPTASLFSKKMKTSTAH